MLQAAAPYQRTLYVLILSLITAAILLLPAGATAGAEGGQEPEQRGWIEVNAEVPEAFNAAVIATVIHAETQEEYDIQLLKANNYTGKRQVPYGEYTVGQAFVPTDIRYGGIPKAESFQITGKEPSAIHIEYQVDILDAYKEDANTAPEAVEDPSVEEGSATEGESVTNDAASDGKDNSAVQEEPEINSDTDAQDTEKAPPSSSTLRIIRNISLSIFATVVFAGLVFLAVLIVRRYIHDDE